MRKGWFPTAILPPAALVLCGLVVHWNSLRGHFYLDDPYNILIPPLLLKDLSFASLKELLTQVPSITRPVANLTFGLNHYLGGPEPSGYHAVNLALHLACGVLTFWLFARLLGAEVPPPRARRAAFLGSLVWIVHPVTPQSVTYVVQRMTVLSALFFLAGFLCYLRAGEAASRRRRAGWWTLTALCYLLAVFSKEMAVVFPAALFLHWFCFGRVDRRGALRRGLASLGAMAAAAALVFLVDAAAGGTMGADVGNFTIRDYTRYERLLTQFRVIFLYLGLILAPTPSRLMLDHYVTKSTGWLAPPTTALAAAGLAALVAGSVLLLRRGRRLPAFLILWFLVNLAVESSVIPLELMFEHRMYLPMQGIIFFVAHWACVWQGGSVWRGRALAAAALALAGVFGVMAHDRNALYADPVRFWEDNARKAPMKARVRNGLGFAYMTRGDLDAALREFRLSLKLLTPKALEEPIVHHNIGLAYYRAGRLADAEKAFLNAVVLRPGYGSAIVNLGAVYLDRGNYRAAVALYRTVEETGERTAGIGADYHHNFGLAYYSLNDYSNAERQFELAKRLDPGLKDVNLFMGRMSMARGELDRAAFHFAEEFKVSGDPAMLNYCMGEIAARRGDAGAAARHYRAAADTPGESPYRAMAAARLRK